MRKYVLEGYGNKDVGKIIGMDDGEVVRIKKRLGIEQPVEAKMLDYNLVEYDRQTMLRKRKRDSVVG